jgi:prepilin peptidase CpaA
LPAITDAIALAAVSAGTLAAALIDLRTRRVPNGLTMGMAAAGVLLAAAGGGRVTLGASIAGCVLGAVLMLPGHVFGATGAGDVKLLAASGALLGPALTWRAFLATAIAGGVLAVIVARRRGRLRATLGSTGRFVAGGGADAVEDPAADNRFAYAPAIAAGVLTVVAAHLGLGIWDLGLGV